MTIQNRTLDLIRDDIGTTNMIQIISLKENEKDKWDSYVRGNAYASVYHLSFFKTVIEETYNHRSYYFLATDIDQKVIGVLPLFFINSILFGKALVSLPFCDYGGILANDIQTGNLLLQKAFELSVQLKCPAIELRQTAELEYVIKSPVPKHLNVFTVNTSKVRMKVCLPDSADELFSSFSAKLRSQIRKPQKENCTSLSGGLELLDDFYDVFVHNMRDLGSPVHKKSLMKRMLLAYPEHTKLFVIYHQKIPVACSMVSGFNDTLVNPWASFKRTYQKIAPNMLLYWEMLIYAIDKKYKFFDFGRSTPDEGTFKFKAQWGAEPEQLFWYNSSHSEQDVSNDQNKKDTFIHLWQKLPLSVTKICGPLLRKHIHL